MSGKTESGIDLFATSATRSGITPSRTGSTSGSTSVDGSITESGSISSTNGDVEAGAQVDSEVDYASELLGGAKKHFDKAEGCDSLNKDSCPTELGSEPQFWDAMNSFIELAKLTKSSDEKKLMNALLAASMGNCSYFSSANLEEIKYLLSQNTFSLSDDSGLSPQRQIAPLPGSSDAKAQQKSIYKNQLLDFDTYKKISEIVEKAKDKAELEKYITNFFKYGLFLRICYFVYMYSLLLTELEQLSTAKTVGNTLPYSNKYFFKKINTTDSVFDILIIEDNKTKKLNIKSPNGPVQKTPLKINYDTLKNQDEFPEKVKQNFFYPICMLINYLQFLTENKYLENLDDMLNADYKFLVNITNLREIQQAIFDSFAESFAKTFDQVEGKELDDENVFFKYQTFLEKMQQTEGEQFTKLKRLQEAIAERVKSDSDEFSVERPTLETEETYVALAKDTDNLKALFTKVPKLPTSE